MTEILEQFIAWTKLKVRIHISEHIIYFREGEIWWACLGLNIGYEQNGKNENFERPVLVVKKFSRHMLWVIPLSSKLKDHPYYHQYKLNNIAYSAILIQLRLVSSKRLLRKVGIFPEEDFVKVKGWLKNML